ncbi:MAG: hypothetical protein AAF573_22225 [Bacteroidota bacterium]
MMVKKRYILIICLACLFVPRSMLSLILKKESPSHLVAPSEPTTNKIFLSKYKAQCLQALAYYPELANAHIEFREASIGTTMAARPIISSFFNTDYERKYEIIFNNAESCEVPFDELPEEGQVGILGHELAHILDYETKSLGQIILTGCFYANAHCIRSYERSIDKITLERGLGKDLYHAYHYILEDSQASEKYKAFKMFHYLKPTEILQKLATYAPSDQPSTILPNVNLPRK